MNPIIILVAPQMGENIGATARGMKNFGLDELRIITPRDGWSNEQARSNAVGAVNIIDNTKIYNSLEECIKDLEYLYATTCIKREMNKDYVFLQNLTADYPSLAKVGIMFGHENNGSSNEEISFANKIITINTTEFSLLNITQEVIIVCYELFRNSESREDIYNIQKLATKEEINHFLTNLFGKLDKAGFFKAPDKKHSMQQNITNIFMRINNLSTPEIQTLQGIIKSLNNS